jgi:FKBP-type peptidyl-prolyl cis-trans isomerase
MIRFCALALLVFALQTPAFAEGVTEAASPAEAASPTSETVAPATVTNKEVYSTKAMVKKTERRKEKKSEAPKKEEKAAARPDGLVIEDLQPGSGAEAKLGSKITVHYRGTLQKGGKEFDSSLGKDPITFDLLEGRLIKGWTEGIPGMKVGGKRKLAIPYALAYGDRGTPDGAIPPKSDLNFEVELIDVK